MNFKEEEESIENDKNTNMFNMFDNLKRVNTENSEKIIFTKDYLFDFYNLYPKKHTCLLQADEIPYLNENKSFQIIKNRKERGISNNSEKIKLEKRRNIQEKMGYFVPPVYIFKNANLFIHKIDEKMKILSVNELIECSNKDNIIEISFENIKIQEENQENIFQLLSEYRNLEILSLKGTGIKNLPENISQSIKICDFCNNYIDDGAEVVTFAQSHKSLAVIDYRRNPISINETIRQNVIAVCYNLKYINGREITVQDRVQSMYFCQDIFNDINIEKLHFFYQVKNIPEISVLSSWSPKIIQHLSLPNCGLTTFVLFQFENLISLNLSHNNITMLKGTGLACCKKLVSLDLSYNEIQDINQINALVFNDSLLHIWLTNNNITAYRNALIYLCRNLNGTKGLSGLQSIDGIPVTIEDYVLALNMFNKANEEELLKWELNIKNYIGNENFNTGYNITSLSLNNCGISQINLSFFQQLTHLNLRGNKFEFFNGLKDCQQLIYIDISNNPNLNLEKVLYDISFLRKLQYLMIADDCWRSDLNNIAYENDIFNENCSTRSIQNKSFRNYILKKLIGKLPFLSMLDRMHITVKEIWNVLKRTNNIDENEIYNYITYLSFLIAAVPNKKIDYSNEQINPGIQYNPEEIKSMRLTRNCGLKSFPFLNFSIFLNLQELDLSYNKIKTVSTLGLDKLSFLKYLDLSYNEISDKLQIIAQFIDSIPNIEAISLRGNPVLKGINKESKRRLKLISFIKRIQILNDSFKVIDYEISPQDIINAHKLDENMKPKEKSNFLLSFSIKIRTPFNFDKQLIQELNLNNCSLSIINLSDFSSLRLLYLANNNLSKASDIQGLEKNIKLEFLDLKNNKFTNIIDISIIIMECSKLQSIEIDGNPFTDIKYKIELLSKLPGITDPHYPFISIDNIMILPSEIKKATKSKIINDKFCFEYALAKNISTTTILNLSYSEIKYLDFGSFRNIEKLNLSHNYITIETILDSNLCECNKLSILDLSYNNIQDIEGNSLGNYLSSITSLKYLNIEKNPICPKINSWISFMTTFIGIVDVSCKFQSINGHKLTLDDRVKIISRQSHNEEISEGYKCLYLLSKISTNFSSIHSVSLPNCNLSVLTPIMEIDKLFYLDLSSNNIKTLLNQGFEKLTELKYLNIKNNYITNLDEIKCVLCKLPKLEKLYIKNSTSNRSETKEPKKYINEVCKILRGLEELDQYLNPHRLKASHLNGLKDLEQITGWYNPNHIHDIDLSNKNISEDDFNNIIKAIASLSPTKLDFRDNPCCSIEKFRFIVIYNVPSVEILDGTQVTVNERMNADKSIRYSVGESKFNRVVDAGVFLAENLDEDERNGKIQYAKKALSYARKFGSILTKWEIFISFQQILCQTVNFFKQSIWPLIYIYFSWIIFPFTIDLSFLKFLLDIKLPFWFSYLSHFIYILLPSVLFGFYHMQLNKAKWYRVFSTNYSHTIVVSIFALFLAIIGCVSISFLCDFNTFYEKKVLSNNQKAWLVVLITISVIIFIIFHIVAVIFRKKCHKPIFWFQVLKFKKRFALFFLTILYYPIVKEFVSVFECKDGHSSAFDSIDCFTPKDFNTLHLIHVTALFFGLLYGIGIPWFFAILINHGVNEIDLNYKISTRLKQLSEKEKEAKKMKKNGEDTKELEKQLKITKNEIRKCYSEAAIQYENAASYLYNAYKREDRYHKVISMVWKLVYLLISTFVPSKWVVYLTNTGLMAVASVYQFFTQPFVALCENIFESIGKVCNLLTAIVGNLLEYFNTNKFFKDDISPYILIGLVVIMFVTFIFLLIKNHCCKNENINDKKENNTIYDNVNDKEDGFSSYNTLRTLKIGDEIFRTGNAISIDDLFNSDGKESYEATSFKTNPSTSKNCKTNHKPEINDELISDSEIAIDDF